jgi:uncharacterized protein DUF5677
MLPSVPNISEEQLQRCRETGDYCPVLFEWYKFVGGLCVTFSCLERESPALRIIPENEYAILIGLLNRCARLMLANVALSHNGKFGETTAIIDRCIFESCVILSWLCRTSDSDRFTRYTANGLKTELELRKQIRANILQRGGAELIIERRMLESIERCIRDSGLTEVEATTSKKLPNLASMITAVGKSRLMYTVGQRIGSHHVHGTWVSLNVHYLERDELGNIHPRDHHCATHANEYDYVAVVVLDAMSAFVGYVFPECREEKRLLDYSRALKERFSR